MVAVVLEEKRRKCHEMVYFISLYKERIWKPTFIFCKYEL